MSFQEKYLKYKKKYLSLKNQVGGMIKNKVNKIIKNQVGGTFHCPRCGYNEIQLTILNMENNMQTTFVIDPRLTIENLKSNIQQLHPEYPVHRQKLFIQNPAYIADDQYTHHNSPEITLENYRRILDYAIPNNIINILIEDQEENHRQDDLAGDLKYVKKQVGGSHICPICDYSFETINITVRTSPNNFNIDISPETTIEHLKEAIYSEHPEYLPRLQRLYIDRPGYPVGFAIPLELDDHRKYSDYPIQNNTIDLSIIVEIEADDYDSDDVDR